MGGGNPPTTPPPSILHQKEEINVKQNEISNIVQLDGADTLLNESSKISDNSQDVTNYSTDDEQNYDQSQANLFPVPGQNLPLKFDVNLSDNVSSCLPLCIVTNARSCYNKCDSLNDMLTQIRPTFLIISETWERKNNKLETLIKSKYFKTFSYFRNNKPGGGYAIIYKPNGKFKFHQPDIHVPENVEAVWAICTPISANPQMKVKRIAIGSIYISPRSKFKCETIEHIIDSIHMLRAKYNNDIHYCIGGDFNKTNISDILESYGAIKQIVSIPTRKSAILEIILTDLHTLYYPPTTLPPLQVDDDKKGQNSDHDVVVFAPNSNAQYRVSRKKQIIKSRPIPESNIFKFEKEVASINWEEKLANLSANQQTTIFHDFLRSNLEHLFPEKSVKMSSLDQRWMSPELKNILRKMQREYFHNRKSQKYKKLKAKFKKLKRTSIKKFYNDFLTELKTASPGKWYQMARKLGTGSLTNDGEVMVESLTGLNNLDAAQKIGEHFSKILNEYQPIDNTELPCYLPAPMPPQLEEYDVYLRLKKIKKTKSTLPMDIPDSIRQGCEVFLAEPLTIIFNNCLQSGIYPSLWKQEYVTPAPKI